MECNILKYLLKIIFSQSQLCQWFKKRFLDPLFFSGMKIVDRNINIYLKMKNGNDNLLKYIFLHWLFIWIEKGRWLQTKPCGTPLLLYFDRLISHCVVPLLSSFLCFFPHSNVWFHNVFNLFLVVSLPCCVFKLRFSSPPDSVRPLWRWSGTR